MDPEQAKYLTAAASAEVIGPELDKLAKAFGGSSSGGLFKMTATATKPTVPKPPPETDSVMPTLLFPCCNEEFKHDGENADLFCVICGTEMTGIDPG